MTDAQVLWAAVESSYDADGLITLTNIRDRSAVTINSAAGESAAQGVIDLWPIYAQEAFDATNALHVEVGKFATIAMLWRRGGSASSIAKVEWDEVFGDGGQLSKLRGTGSRGRAAPATNSGVQSLAEARHGRSVLGWSDRDSIPSGILPSRRSSSPYDD